MSYFVTGATGFIGRHLVRALLQRGRSTVYVLVRGRSLGKLDELREFWGKDAARRVIPVKGDLAQAGLGIGKPDLRKLKGKVTHFFHLGAVYDIEASAEAMHRANILGTEHALAFAHAVDAGCFHFVSSIAAAGLYRGTFTEDMFEEARTSITRITARSTIPRGWCAPMAACPSASIGPAPSSGIRRPAS